MFRPIAAALLAGLFALAATAARSAETTDDTARFLAGMPPAADSPLAALAKSPGWEQHAHSFDSMFAHEDRNTLSKIRAFSKEQLPDKHRSMLYMFSGPDFLYATTFFPTASTYVLSGLEPVGNVPSLTSLPRPTLEAALRNIEVSLGSVMNFSFFITKNMKTQLQAGPVYGTLPVLYVFLARTGKAIHDVTFVSLDAQGNLQEPAAPGDREAARKFAESAAKGVRIVFSDGSGPNQTLYYFSTNVDDPDVQRSGFLQFCDRLGTADSLIKSASYLLHYGGFARIRNFILARSATIVEDDSGIPLAYFDPKKWRLRPFGRYLGPISEFPSNYQPAMEQLFSKDATPIDFGIGYRWQRNESNLLVAERTAPPGDESVISAALTTTSQTFGPVAEISKYPPKPVQPDENSAWGGPFRRLFGPRWSN